MANHKLGAHHDETKNQILYVAARSFLDNGYNNTTIREIAKETGFSSGTITNLYSGKEEMLSGLVAIAIEKQFEVTNKLLYGKTDDKIMFYAAETALQLHICELNENLREVYMGAYSFEVPSKLLHNAVADKMEYVFKEQFPGLAAKDFYILELASGGVMRGYMSEPCSMWFTMEQKVRAFLECSLAIYRISEEKIKEACEFVKQFDFEKIARQTVDEIIEYLDKKKKELE